MEQGMKMRRKRRKVCHFCVGKVHALDYKEISQYRRSMTDRGKMIPKRNSGVCAKHQRMLSMAIKRARYIGLLPYSLD